MRSLHQDSARARMRSWGLLGFALLLAAIVYWPGLSGGWLFDDYPNIVDNRGVQPPDAHLSSLVRAALSSPSSEFKRPLASLSFAANYLVTGLDPYWMKLTNLVIHLVNGGLLFLLTRRLLLAVRKRTALASATPAPDLYENRSCILAVLVAAAWLVLPINLTGVLYVVQRMESLANVFVLLGLIGYVTGRQRMLAGHRGVVACALSITLPTTFGLLAKETAVMLPLYAFLTEWIVFGFRRSASPSANDWRVLLLFSIVLILPMLAGLAWIVPHVFSPAAFSTRDYTLGQRLLSETRIVTDYIGWTLLPTPNALSFYHDDFHASTGLLSPWTTLASLFALTATACAVVRSRHSHPLFALGLAFYLGCHLLTGTILPLELIYEHRNYFASFGLLLAVIPFLAAPRAETAGAVVPALSSEIDRPLPMSLPRHVALGGLLLFWAVSTGLTAHAWGDPLRLAIELADRAPDSPRAQYELGRMYIIYSHYERNSPFTQLAYAPLERAAAMPSSSILPQQALIFMNSRMDLPLKDSWWDSMIAKLGARRPGVQDESSLSALAQCSREGLCHLPPQRMVDAFLAALSHPNPSARLLATYGDYAWNVLGDRQLGLNLSAEAMTAQPAESAYRITYIRMLVALGRARDALHAYHKLEQMNIGGELDTELENLRQAIDTLDIQSRRDGSNG
ncbi:MAG TPA: hypothetical protein VGU65_01440 [Frateuria sp.]|uniref:hypothetical protein n=1 Tax=Frateuria sp. TaxID=2211372 RepID=UPI002DEE21CB|nr:hypothetical protein [Frateuria sp.]